MKFMKLFKGALLATFLMAGFAVFGQGVTTSSINGRITDNSGEPLIGANVLATHTPSGTNYGNSTDLDGFFRIPGMRVGGPYTISISYTGYDDFIQENVFLTLGQSFQLNTNLAEAAVQLEGIEVVASRSDIFDGNRTGQETIVDEEIINSLPTISRSIADFTRYNPLVSVDEGNDGFSFNIAGQNNRYNAVYIDGAISNDQFGLAGSGFDGGQTGAGPISIDAIEQIQVSVAPFDVRLSGFAGGAVNAVTRSGTNDWIGSAYYLFRNESLAGKTPNNDLEDDQRERLDDFTAQTYGFRLGGPIVKNKLFFFVNAELQRDEIPTPFDFNDYNGDATTADIDALESKLKGFGYEPGTFTNNATTLDKNFFIAKLNWNISQNHKLSLRHSYNDIENLEARNSNSGNIRYENGSEFFPSLTNNTVLELNSIFGNKYSNNLKIGYKTVRDDRDVFGQDFPNVRIDDGEGRIEFGGERFSSANRLDQDVFTLANDFQIFQGRHTFTIGTQNEFYSMANLFIRENFGAYQYRSLADFLNDQPSRQFDRSFSQVDNIAGDESAAIADFNGFQLGFYLQDEFQASENFKITAGVRLDIDGFPDDVPENTQFNTETIPAIEALYGSDALKGAATGTFVNTQFRVAPRVGFNWDVNGNRETQIRGGIGVFNSRMPLVWFGGAYNNYGFNIGGTRLRDTITFNPDVQNQPPGQIDVNNPSPRGQIDLFAEDMKLPQVLKTNLAVDQKLPFWGLIGTVEFLYTKNLNNVFYQSLNLRPSTESLTGTGDDRPIFNVFDEVDPTYTGVYLASNTNKGYAYNAVFSLTKPFDNGFMGTLSYTYGDAFSINDGTSSQNNSQWRGYVNVGGRNVERDAERSIYSPGHRIFASVTYRKEYLNIGATALTLTYNGQSGRPFYYSINSNGFGGMVNDGAFNDSDPIYVPRDRNDIILVDTDNFTADQQWTILDQFINDNNSLSDNRGGYARIGGERVPFTNIIDLRLTQDLFLEMSNGKRHTLQATFDIFNFTNMLGNLFGSDWGKIYGNSFGNYNLLNFEGFQPESRTPTYTVDSDVLNGEEVWEDNVIDSGRLRSSRWQMQIGLRYIFN